MNNHSCVLIQDSIDLFLGNYAVDEADGSTPLRDPHDWKFLTVRGAQEDGLIQHFFLFRITLMRLFSFSSCLSSWWLHSPCVSSVFLWLVRLPLLLPHTTYEVLLIHPPCFQRNKWKYRQIRKAYILYCRCLAETSYLHIQTFVFFSKLTTKWNSLSTSFRSHTSHILFSSGTDNGLLDHTTASHKSITFCHVTSLKIC